MSARFRLALLSLLLLARASSADWATGAQTEVPLEGNGSGWLVHATLNGKIDGLFLLDTGASICVLAPGTARQLDLPAAAAQVELRTANGTVRAPVVQLRSVDVGGNRVRDVEAVIHPAVPPPLDGIIGLSVLDPFSDGVDPRRRGLRLR